MNSELQQQTELIVKAIAHLEAELHQDAILLAFLLFGLTILVIGWLVLLAIKRR